MISMRAIFVLLGIFKIAATLPINGQFNFCNYYCGEKPAELVKCTYSNYYNVSIDCSSYREACTLLMVQNSETAVEICRAAEDVEVVRAQNMQAMNKAIAWLPVNAAIMAEDGSVTEDATMGTVEHVARGTVESDAVEVEAAGAESDAAEAAPMEEDAPAVAMETAPKDEDNVETAAADEQASPEAPAAEQPAAEAAAVEEPAAEAAAVEEPVAEAVAVEEPAAEAAVVEEPAVATAADPALATETAVVTEAKTDAATDYVADEPADDAAQEMPQNGPAATEVNKVLPAAPPTTTMRTDAATVTDATHKVTTTNAMESKCYTCNSTADKNCKKKPTDFINCSSVEGREQGCYTLAKNNATLVGRGCIADLNDADLKYCKENAKFCVMCSKELCNKLNAPSNAAHHVPAINWILYVMMTSLAIYRY